MYLQTESSVTFKYDPSIKHLLIVGTDDTGWAVAQAVRQYHPYCAIAVIGPTAPPCNLPIRVRHLRNRRVGRRNLALSAFVRATVLSNHSVVGVQSGGVQSSSANGVIGWINAEVATIDAGQRKLWLVDGSVLPYERLILSTSTVSTQRVNPLAATLALAHACGLKVNRGILVDERSRTSDPFVLAIGDHVELDWRVANRAPIQLCQATWVAASAVAGAGVYQLPRGISDSRYAALGV